MVFLSQNGHNSPGPVRADTLPVAALAEDHPHPDTAALRFEWPLWNDRIDAAQLPVFREFLSQLGPR
jgi:hypothetical protein